MKTRLNLMWRTTLLVWLVSVVTLVIYAAALLPDQKREYLANLRSKAHGVTVSLRDLAAGAVISEDYSSVVDHCTEVLKGDPAIDYIVFTRRDGFSLVHEHSGWRTEQLDGVWRPTSRVAENFIGARAPLNHRAFNLSEPFDYSGIEWGWIHVGLSLESYDASIQRIYNRTLALGAAATLLALVASIAYARLLVRPILHLQSVVGLIASGELKARANTDRSDELGVLAASINSMTEAILLRDRTLHEANVLLEDRVEERTRELRDLIAARELSLKQLAEAQRQLMDLSRQAGMAEVATGILHNVGNVLNSVNVSAHLLRDQLQKSRLASLDRAAEILRQHLEDPAAFYRDDPRAKLLPRLVTELSHRLRAEHQGMATEVETLARNVDHIKEIVSLQQSHAKSGGLFERLPASELLADTLRINSASLARHGIDLDRHCDDDTILTTDRHKVLQILVNLLSNAINATKARPVGARRISFRFEKNEQTFSFVVEDNGSGIAPENLTRIFQHGFTTRKGGHGFGLHSGALVARLLGGKIEAHSPGVDGGARFTLVLPLLPPPQPS